jgi:hypothetical protein
MHVGCVVATQALALDAKILPRAIMMKMLLTTEFASIQLPKAFRVREDAYWDLRQIALVNVVVH